MNQLRWVAAVLVLVLVGGLAVAGAADKAIKKKKKHHIASITPGSACSAPDVTLSQSNQDFVTWTLASGTDTYEVRFDKGQGTPCDNGEDTLDLEGSGDESTACTVQNVKHPKRYKYSIYKMVGGSWNRCADPSVDVQP